MHPRKSTVPRLLALLLGLAAVMAAPDSLSAQYFGRNKVQYETFDFRVLKTEHFDIYFYPEMEIPARAAGRMAERWYARLSTLLGHEFEERQPVVLYASHPEFQQTNVIGSTVGEGTGGVTEAFKQRVVMPLAYSYEETDHVLGHELVHAFQYDISGLGRAGGGLEAAARRFQVPLWFTEGMAEYLSVGPVDPLTAMWVRDAALQGEIPTIEEMTYDPRVFPYRWGQAFWSYIAGRWGDAVIGQILTLAGQGVPYPQAFQQLLNTSLEEISEDWHAAIRRSYLPLIAERPEARQIAEPLITQDREGGRLNVGPVLSPDGKYVAFLSELDFLDVELYLADAETGEVIRRLQRGTAFDPHFGSLRYINSAGAWSPDSRLFAFPALRGAHDVLVILDVSEAERIREIAVPGVSEISNPAWSPDGRSIAFSGMEGGTSDLYLLDLETEEIRRLTDDPYADMQPAFSPDGSTLVFVTDRGPATDLTQLTYGIYRLAFLDLEDNAIRLAPAMEGQKNFNPAWTRDGNGVYFISNRTGIPNVYRLDIDTGELAQITNLFTGVSGITDLSPALTVSRDADRLLFTNFEDGGYNIYALETREELAGTPVPLLTLEGADTIAPVPAVLPPVPRPTEGAFNRVSLYLMNPLFGLPSLEEAAEYAVVPYDADLGLDYLGQPAVGYSTGGAFGGGGVSGGISAIFSDILGRHTLAAAVQAQGQIDEIGGSVLYLNRRGRWNLGAAAQRIPFIYGYITRPLVDSESGLGIRSLVRARLFDTSLQGVAQYPFSTVQRAEFSAGLRRLATDNQVFTQLFDARTGQATRFMECERATEELSERFSSLCGDDGVGLNLIETSAALVYDNALSGYTSPFAGQRYRFSISPTFGELQFVQALADYRRYFFLRPFTLAFQGYHTGRYGEDAEGNEDGQRLFNDLYLGQPWYVRGYYDAYSECRTDRTSCDVLPQLFGSRIGLAKAELRFPLIRALVFGPGIGLPPIEGFAFYDAGIAWGQGDEVAFRRFNPNPDDQELERDQFGQLIADERNILTSAGVGARVNLLGYLILEVNYVNAFEREEGWHWQFNFSPGF